MAWSEEPSLRGKDPKEQEEEEVSYYSENEESEYYDTEEDADKVPSIIKPQPVSDSTVPDKPWIIKMFITLCEAMLMMLDLVCNLVYPATQTLYIMLHYRKYEKTENEVRKNEETIQEKERREAEYKIVQHWTTYWIFYTVLQHVQRMLYFFPFSYELKVLLVLLMAHPKIEAATTAS